MRALFFDLDGTLTDPAPGIVACMQHALQVTGSPARDAVELKRFIGPPLHSAFASLLSTQDTTLVERAVQAYRERFGRIGLYENRVYPGIANVLQQLAQQFRLFVVTSKPHPFARTIVEHFALAPHFAQVYGSELNGVRSDKTELIGHVLERERLPARRAIMIGDREHDIIGAQGNSVASVAVTWGYGARQELELARPTRLVTQISELTTTLQALAATLPE